MGLSWYGKLVTFYNILQPPLAVFSLSSLSSSKSVQNTSQLNSILRPKRWASSPKRREGCKHWRQMRSVLLHKGTRLSRGSVRDCCQLGRRSFPQTLSCLCKWHVKCANQWKSVDGTIPQLLQPPTVFRNCHEKELCKYQIPKTSTEP